MHHDSPADTVAEDLEAIGWTKAAIPLGSQTGKSFVSIASSRSYLVVVEVTSAMGARRSHTDGPPKSFHDILPPELITTSTLSEAGYLGYRKPRFTSLRSSTLPAPTTSKSPLEIAENEQLGDHINAPSRRSTIKRMQGVMHSIRRSMTSFNGSKTKSRSSMPTSSGFGAGISRFDASKRAQGYQDVDSDDGDGEGGEN